MKRAILTITRNSSHIFKYFIQSYQEYCDRDAYNLVICDNNSREGDWEYLKTYADDGTIDLITRLEANYLFTYSTNLLMDLAKDHDNYDQYIIVNPDIEFREGWDVDLDDNKGIMGFVLVKPGGSIEHAGGYGGGDHVGRGEIDRPDKFTEIREVDWVTFGAVAIAKPVLEKVGHLNEDFAHFGSDREYCRRAREAGFTVSCSPSRLTHSYGYSTRPYVWRDVPDEIWKKMVEERRGSGVYFPSRQEDF